MPGGTEDKVVLETGPQDQEAGGGAKEQAKTAEGAVQEAAEADATATREITEEEIDAIFSEFDLGSEGEAEEAGAAAKADVITREEHERALVDLRRSLAEAKEAKEEAEEEGERGVAQAATREMKAIREDIEALKRERIEEKAAREQAKQEASKAELRDTLWETSGRIAGIALGRMGFKPDEIDPETLEVVQDSVFNRIERLHYRSPRTHPVKLARDNALKLIKGTVESIGRLVPASSKDAAGTGSETASRSKRDSGSEAQKTTPSSGGARRGTATEKADLKTDEGRKKHFAGIRARAEASLRQAGRYSEGGDPNADPFGES